MFAYMRTLLHERAPGSRKKIQPPPERRVFLVEITDNESGIPPEAQPLIFAVPFFTTKGEFGTGPDLAITHRIVVERHQGKIDFTTGPTGTQLNVRLPSNHLVSDQVVNRERILLSNSFKSARIHRASNTGGA
jgi:nitrogen-specific signal transduction histidine kinase